MCYEGKTHTKLPEFSRKMNLNILLKISVIGAWLFYNVMLVSAV